MALPFSISSIKSLFLLVFCLALRAMAQFSSAGVAGVVQDSSKAAITDAKLKLINTDWRGKRFHD
jgi:hypothetical protein